MASATSTDLTIDQLQQLANDPAQTLNHLIAVLLSVASNDEDRVNWASEALENCGVPAETQLSSITEQLGHSDPMVVTWSCKLLARLGTAAGPVQDRLADVLAHHTDLLVREEAARAIGVITTKDASGHACVPLTAAAIAALEQATTEGGPRLKRLANAALGR